MNLFSLDPYITEATLAVEGEFHLRSLASSSASDGGSFDYGSGPSLFLGRRGVGPLRVAWDTSILIDWAEYGHILAEDGGNLPDGLEPGYADELLSLGVFMNLPWMTRDIRIFPLRRQRDDFRRTPSGDVLTERERQLDRIADALWHALPDEDYPKESELEPGHRWELRDIVACTDRRLVEEAIVSGCHIFVCRDRRIIGWSLQTEAFGMRVLSPTSLIDSLAEAGELNHVFGVDGVACDNHKWQHLFEVTRHISK